MYSEAGVRAGAGGAAEEPSASRGDAELLHAAAARDAQAFRELVSRYYQPVYRLTWRLTGGHADTEDIAQEAFLKLWQNPSQVRQAGALRGWLMRVASNAVIDRARRKPHNPLDDVPEVQDPAPSAGAELDRSAAARAIDRRIAALPDRQRLALTLVHFEGMTNIDAASVLEISIDAVKSLLARARRALRESLKGEWRQLLEGLEGEER
ncbi:RNA polymerase sigma factor [Aestuariivirga sp.]|uniref:RNA polymerase sigma factor n=1 Tax=Aestuariivirga sp. TaxID=2650926 RepID=UPI0039E3BE09